jgi:aerobic carbon-monoxide dehydrogenase medium subunit
MMRYESPVTVKDAVTLLAKEKGQAFVLAGGTDLLVKLKAGMVEPDLVVDIKRIKGMRDIKKSASGFVIGAGTPCSALGEDKALVKAWPGVVEAAGLIGSKQVQGRCTMSGNLSISQAPRASANSTSKTCPPALAAPT